MMRVLITKGLMIIVAASISGISMSGVGWAQDIWNPDYQYNKRLENQRQATPSKPSNGRSSAQDLYNPDYGTEEAFRNHRELQTGERHKQVYDQIFADPKPESQSRNPQSSDQSDSQKALQDMMDMFNKK